MNILEEASVVIHGDREKTYGDPGRNIRAIAEYWTTYIRSRGGMPEVWDLNYDDVCNMMVLLKVARLANSPMHRDSLVDACGYLALAERIQDADKHEEESPNTQAP